MTPQAALDAPRFCISAGLPDADTEDAANAGNIDSEVWMEEGISDEVVEKLRGMLLFSVRFMWCGFSADH